MARAPILCSALFALAIASCTPRAAETVKPSPAALSAQSREACVDAWIKSHGLNAYGDPQDTMYAGGTPLFNERTGRRTDRIDYVVAHHPELAALCPAPDGG